MNNAYIRAQQCKVKEAKFPFVKIGEQYWTTKNLSLAVTPQGNTIPEMQANGNVEKIVNGGFSGTTDWVDTNADGLADGFTITNGIIPVINDYSGDKAQKITKITGSKVSADMKLSQTPTIGKFYKLTIRYRASLSSDIALEFGNVTLLTNNANWTTINNYGLALSLSSRIAMYWASANDWVEVDYISIQEIGWSGSQELYDGIYAQTVGTVEQKTYAAVKAAAMWSNYYNNAYTGLTYGKLYNWFAVKLLQMDIDYYNAANPTKPYIWRVPTVANGNTLNTYLGGDTIAGGKIKIMGNVYYTDNIGATNETGLTILGAGSRDEGGGFASINARGISWSQTEVNPTVASYCIYTKNTDATNQLSASNKMRGYSIRLIKA